MNNNDIYTYRLMKTEEANYVYDIILQVFHKHVAPAYSEEGVKTFLSMLSPEFLKVMTPEQFTIVAEQNGQICGTSSIINKSHIALLFEKSEMQAEGVGNSLIQFAAHECLENNPDVKSITVSSSPNSLTFYQNVGFAITEEEKNEQGMRCIPMEKRFPNIVDKNKLENGNKN